MANRVWWTTVSESSLSVHTPYKSCSAFRAFSVISKIITTTPVAIGWHGLADAISWQQDARFMLPLEILLEFIVALSLSLRRDLLKSWLSSILVSMTY